MKAIAQVMAENNFIILDTVEEAEVLAIDMRERERHCTCIIAIGDGTFTVWPEGYAMKAGIEPVKVFHMHEVEGDEDTRKRVDTILRKLFGKDEPHESREAGESSQEAHHLMKAAIGCLLMRNGGKLEFKADEIDRMTDLSYGFEIRADSNGFQIIKQEMH